LRTARLRAACPALHTYWTRLLLPGTFLRIRAATHKRQRNTVDHAHTAGLFFNTRCLSYHLPFLRIHASRDARSTLPHYMFILWTSSFHFINLNAAVTRRLLLVCLRSPLYPYRYFPARQAKTIALPALPGVGSRGLGDDAGCTRSPLVNGTCSAELYSAALRRRDTSLSYATSRYRCLCRRHWYRRAGR